MKMKTFFSLLVAGAVSVGLVASPNVSAQSGSTLPNSAGTVQQGSTTQQQGSTTQQQGSTTPTTRKRNPAARKFDAGSSCHETSSGQAKGV